MIDGHTTLGQYFLKITIGHGITDLEKYGVDDHGFWIMCAFEINGHEGFPACSSVQSYPTIGKVCKPPIKLSDRTFLRGKLNTIICGASPTKLTVPGIPKA